MTPYATAASCHAYEQALIAVALGAALPQGLEDHLAGCPACRRKLSAYRQMRAGLLCGPVVGPGEHMISRLTRLLAGRLTAGRARGRWLTHSSH